MESLNGFQTPVEGVFLKVIVDVLRKAFPQIDQRWVHLAVLVGALVLSGLFHRSNLEEFLSSTLAVFLATIGANEVVRRTRSPEDRSGQLDAPCCNP